MPSEAPSDAHCGLYQDSDRTVFVTSGVGTSILPLRYGAQSQWDLIALSFMDEPSDPTSNDAGLPLIEGSGPL